MRLRSWCRHAAHRPLCSPLRAITSPPQGTWVGGLPEMTMVQPAAMSCWTNCAGICAGKTPFGCRVAASGRCTMVGDVPAGGVIGVVVILDLLGTLLNSALGGGGLRIPPSALRPDATDRAWSL